MKPKHQRMIFLGLGSMLAGFALYLILSAFEDSIVFFYTPQQVHEKKIQPSARIRLGGMVVKGSLKKEGLKALFNVSDFKRTIAVHYEGILPDLFREGQGVVMEGQLIDYRHFTAKTVLAKHDENYMPPQVAKEMNKVSEGKP